jgi:hypothetical protein
MVRVGGGWDTLQHFLERHGADPVQQISAADLLPMDTRPAQCSARKRYPLTNPAMASLSTSTNTLSQAGSHAAVAAAVAHHASGHGNVLMNSTQQLLGLPIGHLTAAAAAAAAVALNTIDSTNSAATETSESNFFAHGSSVTPLHNSPEPASSGYCSSNNSNCTLSISSAGKSQSSRRPPSALPVEPRRSNSTLSAPNKRTLSNSYSTVNSFASAPLGMKAYARDVNGGNDRFGVSAIPLANSLSSGNVFKTPNRSAIKTRIPVRQPKTTENGVFASPGRLQRSRSISICSPPTTHFGFRAGARSVLCVAPLTNSPSTLQLPISSRNGASNSSLKVHAPISRIPTSANRCIPSASSLSSNKSRIPARSTGSVSQPTSPSFEKRHVLKRRSSAASNHTKSSDLQLAVSADSIGSIESTRTSIRCSQQSLHRSVSGLNRYLSKLSSNNLLESPKSDSKRDSTGSCSSFGFSSLSRKKSPVGARLSTTPPKTALNVIGQTSLSAF